MFLARMKCLDYIVFKMKVYKILHKPTGLFFIPSRSGRGNLSKIGKIYPRPPRLEWAGTSIRVVLKTFGNSRKIQKHQQILVDYFNLEQQPNGGYWIDKCYKCSPEDWEIIEY